MLVSLGGGRHRAEVARLVELAPDVILCGATELTGEFQRKTRTIPIVFVHVADPVTAVWLRAWPGRAETSRASRLTVPRSARNG